MRKFKINAIRTDEYIIEIDESVWNQETLDAWNSVFGGCDDLEELAEHISFLLLRFGYERFLEGFGYLYAQNEDGNHLKQWDRNDKGELETVTEFANGIKVTIITEDDDYEYETEELA